MKRWLTIVNITVALVIAGMIALQAFIDRKTLIESAYRESENLSAALAQETRQLFGGIGLALLTVADDIQKGDAANEAERFKDSHGLLYALQAASPSTYAFFVLDRDGRLVASSRTPDPESVDLSDTHDFVAQRDGTAEALLIGHARIGRVGFANGKWIVNVSRRLVGADGEFAGIAAASVSVDYMRAFYDALRVGENGAVGLLEFDGTLLLRSPFLEDQMGRRFNDNPLVQEIVSGGVSGQAYGVSPADGVARLVAFSRIEDYGVIAYVSLAENAVLQPWWRRLAFQAIIGLLIVLVFASASIIVANLVQRQRRVEARRVARLKLLADEAAHLVTAPDVGTLLAQSASIARRLVGARQAAVTDAIGPNGGAAAQTDTDPACDASLELTLPASAPLLRRVSEDRRPVLLRRGGSNASESSQDMIALTVIPRNGLLAVPIVTSSNTCRGVLQAVDKLDGGFMESDLHELAQFASVVAVSLDALEARLALVDALAAANAERNDKAFILNSISDGMHVLDRNWRFVYLNAEAERILGRTSDQLIGKVVWDEFPAARQTVVYDSFVKARETGEPVAFEVYYEEFKSWFAIRVFPHEMGVTSYFHDISRRVESEQRLRQAQKLDAIGQLTGGIAHDFNNLLTVILGQGDAVVEYLKASGAPALIRGSAETVQLAGERAAELTHRLLAYARRQPLDPRTTDVNALIRGLEVILRRTVTENVEIEIREGVETWRANVDPGELENAILNLVLNARDAMPDGGKLTIETDNVIVDPSYALENEIDIGPYVVIAVSDTGEGMSRDIVASAFEPFFTTKREGRGSGLGLSMVYGFARQSGGQVKIYSEPDHGTTVRIYLPRAHGVAAEGEVDSPATALPRGDETVLVLEDDDLVRRHTVSSLQTLGYTVLQASRGDQALDILRASARVDLLLTDVVLPGTASGRTVAAQASTLRPGLRVLYMSGYTENAIVHHGRLDPGVELLSKPFRLSQLSRKVRRVLDKVSA